MWTACDWDARNEGALVGRVWGPPIGQPFRHPSIFTRHTSPSPSHHPGASNNFVLKQRKTCEQHRVLLLTTKSKKRRCECCTYYMLDSYSPLAYTSRSRQRLICQPACSPPLQRHWSNSEFRAYGLRHGLDAGDLLHGRRATPCLPGHVLRLTAGVQLLG
jgi:hypothetical protein